MDMVDVLDRGSRRIAKHDSPPALACSAERVLEVLSSYPAHGVVAASAPAERVLGAMMMVSPDVRVGSARDVIIFDVNVASGTVLARAVGRLRRAGHDGRIVVLALHALWDDVPGSIEGADELVILEDSGLGQKEPEGSKNRILVAL